MCSTSKQMTVSSEAKQIIVIDEFNLEMKLLLKWITKGKQIE